MLALQGTCPVAVSLEKDRVHVFTNYKSYLIHRYWDRTKWQPDIKQASEFLGYGLAFKSPAVTTRWSDRLHVMVKDDDDDKYLHKYYDGSAWKPDGSQTWERLGDDNYNDQTFESNPVVNSWEPDRVDISGILRNSTSLHKYWEGAQ